MIPSTLSPKEQQALDDYMAKKLPQYELLNTYPKSNHPDDSYLHMVVARHKTNHTYAVWTCWNTKTESLNHGHYNLLDKASCMSVLIRNYYDCHESE